MAITILDLALYRGATCDKDGALTLGEVEKTGLPFFGGCLVCHASLAAYNAHPTRRGYLVGSCCIEGATDGFETVEEANECLFGAEA